jgi:rod shape-determining protein MreD
MSKMIIYSLAIILDVILMNLIVQIPVLSFSQTIPANTFFLIVLLHTHDKNITFREVLALFTLGLFLDVLYVTPIFVNAVTIVIVIVIAHLVKTYFNDNGFERVVFLLVMLFLKELISYSILFVTFKSTLLPSVWFARRVFFVLVLNIPWIIFSVFVFSKYQIIEKYQQKRRRQKETYNHLR